MSILRIREDGVLLSTGRIGEIYPLHRSDDCGRGQSEDDDAVGRFEGCHQSPPFVHDNVAVSKGGKGDRGKIECRLYLVDRVHQQVWHSERIHRRKLNTLGGPVGTVGVLTLTNHVLAADEELRCKMIDQVGVRRTACFECIWE